MPRYRVGEEGVRVITACGIYSLPPGAELDEIPDHYEGKLIVLELDEVPAPKAVHGYADKAIHPAEDKSL
jgi:hypothetical protein